MAVEEAFRAEARRLADILLALDEPAFDRPTNCPPWRVRDLVAHVCAATGRVTEMLARPAPPAALVDAAGYFSPAKFAAAIDAARVDDAVRGAAGGGHQLAVTFDRTRRAAEAAVVAAPPGRLVRTRHGDAMTVPDFLATRVVELGVHGWDLAAALGRPTWLTEAAGAVIADLLATSPAAVQLPETLGWDPPTLIAKATGRLPLTDRERGEVDRRSVRWPSFG
nr:maleylpyruvate isomerase N-terminal domain-containing protein [Micromonospora sp. DSM 115978]